MRRISTLELLTRIIVEEFHVRQQIGFVFDEKFKIQPEQRSQAEEIAKHSRECKVHARIEYDRFCERNGIERSID